MRAAAMPTVGVVNVHRSRLAEEADMLWPTSAGREIGVAATKTFTTQAMALMLLALRLAAARGTIDITREADLKRDVEAIGSLFGAVIDHEPEIADIARRISADENCVFIGRAADHAVAAEGALKLKELSYIHAEAYPAGELKHGPIAIVRDGLPVIASAGPGRWLEKTLSNLAEVRARGAVTVLITEEGCTSNDVADHVIALPAASPFVSPLLRVVALQLLSVHAAIALDRNVDRPRNLAKSVTVE